MTNATLSVPQKLVYWKFDVLWIIAFAVFVRIATFNGAFGSDDLVYFSSATRLASGDWSAANYNGALRYGFNLPAAGFVAVFGPSLFSANLWPLICSLIEIGAVYIFANAVMNRRGGVFAALLLASAPLHIAVATRIHADPVVSMFLTVSFVMLYFGLQRNRTSLLFGAGLAIGGVFWSKELVAVTWLAFLPLLWFCRGRWKLTVPVLLGVVLMMVLHGILMTIIASDPFHLIRVVLGAVKSNFVDGGQGEDDAGYYFRYLFFDLRHVGLLGFFATVSFLVLPRWFRDHDAVFFGVAFLIMWWVGLLLVLSFFPVSLSPLRLTMKQSNYITLFIAPTALLAGMTLAVLPAVSGRLCLTLCIAFGLVLGAFQQADYRSFTANSKAVADFALNHPEALIVGSTNNSRLGSFLADLENPNTPKADLVSFNDFREQSGTHSSVYEQFPVIYAVLDRQTVNWFAGPTPITTPLSCWKFAMTLTPKDLGLGNRLALLLSSAMATVTPVAGALERLARPQQASVYRVVSSDLFCQGE